MTATSTDETPHGTQDDSPDGQDRTVPGPIADLARLVDRIAPSVSASRRRQLRWLLGELTLYYDNIPAPDLATLLSTDYTRQYLVVAAEGLLRTRGGVGIPSTDSAIRVRRSCLDLLAQAARLPLPDTGPGMNFTLRPKAAPTAAARALDRLTADAQTPNAWPGVVRAALVAALVHHHNLRTGEIADLTLDDIHRPNEPDGDPGDGPDEGAGEVLLTYRPAAPGTGPGYPRTIALSPLTARLLDLWLTVRETVLAENGVERVQHLLISVHGNHTNGVHRPAGMPLQPRGLARAHTAIIASLNQRLADHHGHDPGYAPLPRTLGELRPPTDVSEN